MRDPKSNTPHPEAQSTPILDKQASRQRIQAVIERFVAGQATDADYEVIRDRPFTYCATAAQCCQIIEAAAGRTRATFCTSLPARCGCDGCKRNRAAAAAGRYGRASQCRCR